MLGGFSGSSTKKSVVLSQKIRSANSSSESSFQRYTLFWIRFRSFVPGKPYRCGLESQIQRSEVAKRPPELRMSFRSCLWRWIGMLWQVLRCKGRTGFFMPVSMPMSMSMSLLMVLCPQPFLLLSFICMVEYVAKTV